MILQIDVPDGSNELLVLQEVVADLNAEREKYEVAEGRPKPIAITVEEYARDMLLRPLAVKAKKRYVAHVQGLSDAELESTLGPLSNIRKARP